MPILIQASTKSSFRSKFQHSKKPIFYISDVIGRLINTKHFFNGNVNITLEVNERPISIVEIAPSFAIEKYKIGDYLGFYGLKHKDENTYSMNKYSCVYDMIQ